MSNAADVIKVIVTAKKNETAHICSFELKSVDGSPLPAFDAGAHVDVQIADGLTRSYSLCNSPQEKDRYLIAVLRDPNSRGGSIGMHENLAEGSTLRISRPKNHFPLEKTAQKSILFGGGIGITPVLCMAEELAMQGKDFELHYCGRSQPQMAFLDRISQSGFSDRTAFYFDDVAHKKLDIDKVLAAPDDGKHLYVCGPTGFLEFVVEKAKAHGWQEKNIHFEYFNVAFETRSDDQAFDVQVASTGKVFTVPPDRTIVSVLHENGIDVPVSCEQGICGTCQVNIVEGIADHLDHYLTNAERDENVKFLPCVSRCKSARIVLDI